MELNGTNASTIIPLFYLATYIFYVQDEVFIDGEHATPVPKSTLYDTMRAGSYTAVFESLQAQLKTRDGVVDIYLK